MTKRELFDSIYHFKPTGKICKTCKWIAGVNQSHACCTHPEGYEQGLDFHIVTFDGYCDAWEKQNDKTT